MAEGIEVRFFGKLTYYAISIYVLFVLGLLIVCTKRYKARTQEHRRSSTKAKSDREAQVSKKDMGLLHSRSKDENRSEEAVRQRRSKAEKLASCGEDTRGLSIQNNKTANGQLNDEHRTTLRESFDTSITVESSNKPINQAVVSKDVDSGKKLVNDDGKSSSKSQSSLLFTTSAKDANKSTISCVIGAECEVVENKFDSVEMGRRETLSDDNKEALMIARTLSIDERQCIISDVDTEAELGNDESRDSEQKLRDGNCKVESNFVDKEVSNCVCEALGISDGLNNSANTPSSSIVENALLGMTDRRLDASEDDFERKEKTTMSSESDEVSNNDVCGEDRVSRRVRDRIMEYADKLAKEIIYGYDEGNLSALSPPGGQQHENIENERTIDDVPLRFCQAIANDVCRDAPKAARELEVFCQEVAEVTMISALEEYSNLPANRKRSTLTVDKGGTLLRTDGKQGEVFCPSEDISDDNDFEEIEYIEVESFSNDIGSSIIDNAIIDVKCKRRSDVEKSIATNGTQEPSTNGPNIVVNHFEEGYERSSRDDSFQMRNDSISNLDADDEDDGGEDSCYSDESDKEIEHEPIILRNKNTLKLKLHSDRPLSGYAEQLVQFLADDDDGLDMFESDEEFDAVLDKLEEKYRDNQGVYTKVQKRRKLSESRRKSESSMDACKGERKRIPSLDRLSDEDWRGGLTSTMSESSLLSGTDTDDALKGTLSDDQLMSPSPGKLNLRKTVVVDTGCGTLKAGFAGEIAPSHILPSVIGVPRRFSQDVSNMTRGYYVGEEAISHAGMLQLDHPIKREVTNWSDVFSLLEYVFEDALGVNVRDHPILLTELGLVSQRHREKLTEVMFERFGCQAFFLANQGPLSLYSMGLTSGLCVNSGYSTTQAIPVYEGHSLPYCTRQLNIGGEQITSYLGRQLLSERSLAFSSSSEKFLLSDMMERYCYVPLDLKSERERLKKHYDDVRKFYELPDGQLIDLDVERFQSSEILYDPEIIGLEQKPLHKMIVDSVAAVDQDLKTTLMNNAILTGGTTLLQGFNQRLQSELESLHDHTGQIKLKNANNPVTATWTGASVISSLSTFSQQCITTDQYAETGAHVVHSRCF